MEKPLKIMKLPNSNPPVICKNIPPNTVVSPLRKLIRPKIEKIISKAIK